MVCQFIGAQAQVDTSKHGGRNPLVEMAASIDILGGRSPEERELDRIRGPKVAADPGKGVEAGNPAGSYEALAAMFAGPPPIPGRG
jgi:hypothetical protein